MGNIETRALPPVPGAPPAGKMSLEDFTNYARDLINQTLNGPQAYYPDGGPRALDPDSGDPHSDSRLNNRNLMAVQDDLNRLVNRISNDDRSEFQEVVHDLKKSWVAAQNRLHDEFYDDPYRAEPRIERYERGPILDPTPDKKFAKEFYALQDSHDWLRRFSPNFNPTMSSPISATPMQPASPQTAPLSMPGLLREVLKGRSAQRPVGLLEYLAGHLGRQDGALP